MDGKLSQVEVRKWNVETLTQALELPGRTIYICESDKEESDFVRILKRLKDLFVKGPHRHTTERQARARPCRGKGRRGGSPIAMKISFTFIAVFAEVSMNSKLLSSA